MTHKNHNAEKTDRPLSGVVCNAVHCYYHDNDEECKASGICIDPVSAKNSDETACSTFKPKSY